MWVQVHRAHLKNWMKFGSAFWLARHSQSSLSAAIIVTPSLMLCIRIPSALEGDQQTGPSFLDNNGASAAHRSSSNPVDSSGGGVADVHRKASSKSKKASNNGAATPRLESTFRLFHLESTSTFCALPVLPSSNFTSWLPQRLALGRPSWSSRATSR